MSLFSKSPQAKPRVGPSFAITGAFSRIAAGVFGKGSPVGGMTGQEVGQTAAHRAGYYQFYEGDYWSPGTANWVLDPVYDGPLHTVWGSAFLRTPNTFNPLQRPQVYAPPTTLLYGPGGQVPGQLFTQPLSSDSESAAG